ncbi:protein CROWDED NUCLEI 1 [Populus alba x Populus x berolinensis]|nr:protein CROWDED NUCLEI 1 [Populus alba x Populus x berolinensis]
MLDVESRESTLRMERLSFIAEYAQFTLPLLITVESASSLLCLHSSAFDATRKKLEVKEVELRALEEKLNERERVEIKKLTDEHNAILDAKKHEFELEAEQKKKSLDEDLKNKVIELEKRETEIKHKEEKAAKREQALDKKLEKCKEKENEFESKSKSLKEREKAIRSEQKKFEGEKNQLESAKENFLNLKAELEKTKASNEEQLLKIHEEKERLKVSEEERSEYARLQAELKEEINKCRLQEELLLKEADDLKQQKGNFEREWEDLDEKRAEAEKELKSIREQKEKFEKHRLSEEERIRNERKETENYIKRELEALQVAKESFEAIMEHERQEEMDRLLQEKEKLFEEEREREFKNSNFLRDVARREMEDMKLERLRIEKEKQEVDEKKRHLQEQQIEMREDIDKLGNLSRKLKDHREQFIKEKERFIVFVEQNKDCKNCDDGNLAASEKHDSEISPTLAHSVSPVSWLRKCTSKILKFSAGKRIEPAALQNLTDGTPLSGEQVNAEEMSKRLDFTENEPELSFAIVNDSLDAQRVLSDTSIREVEAGHDLSINDQSNNNGTAPEIQEDSQPSGLKHGPQRRKRGRPRVSRTRSVKEVVQDAKAFLGGALELSEAEESGHLKSESREESSLADKGGPRNARKRNRTQTSQISVSDRYGDDSEGHSDSVTAGDRRKRRQKVVPNQTQGQTQYNLRRRNLGVAVVTAKASSNLNNEKEKEDDGVSSPQDGNLLRSAPAASAGAASENGESMHFARCANVMDTMDGDGSARRMDENAALSEEINGTPEGAGEYGIADENRSETPRGDNEDEDEDDDEEESLHPGEVSIGKKLWTFLTT